MTGSPVTLRCVACGRLLAAIPTPSPWASWVSCPHCGHPVAVVAPRDPPPLFTWEVHPEAVGGARPALFGGPRTARWWSLLLIGTVAALVGSAGALAVLGFESLAPGEFHVAGTVVRSAGGSELPVGGVSVTATGESGPPVSAVTGPAGTFDLGGLPAGSVRIEAEALGGGSATVVVFVSSSFSSVGTPADPVTIELGSAASSGNASGPILESTFGGLEDFLSSLFAASLLLGLAAVVGLVAVVVGRRGRHPAVVVAGGSAAALAPFALPILGIGAIFPWVTVAAAGGGALGLAAASLAAVRLAADSPPLAPEE